MYSTTEHWQSDFELKGIEPNDLVIGLAYNQDGGKPKDYTVVSIATLSCKDDKLIVGKPLVPFLAWNRVEGKCGHDSSYKVGIMDGFIDEDQAYYLQQLQDKYPTCNKLNAAFPSGTDKRGLSNSTDSVNTHSTSKQDSHPQISFWEKVKFWFRQWI